MHQPKDQGTSHPSRLVGVVATMLVLAACAASGCRAEDRATTLATSIGNSLELEITKGRAREVQIDLVQGAFAKIIVQQMGVDVVVQAFAPDGSQIKEVDSPNGAFGPEPVDLAAKQGGRYRLRVRPLSADAVPGRVNIRLDQLLSPEQYAEHSINPTAPETLHRFNGAYQVSKTRTIHVGLFDELGGRLTFTDTETLRFGVLHQHSATEFFTGPTAVTEYPAVMDFTFELDAAGSVRGLRMSTAGGVSTAARRTAPDRIDAIEFKHDGITLRGDLYWPLGTGPHPAIVIATGSGPATRNVTPWPTLFAELGFAVLSFDKRGTGTSEGDYRTAGLDALAGDVLAGVEALKSRPNIDAKRIGIWGVSQGGWVGSLAASRSSDVSFLVIHAGSGVQVHENVVHEAKSLMRDAGLAGDELARGEAFAREIFRMAADGVAPAEVAKVVAASTGRPWVSHVFMANAPAASPWWPWFRLNGHVDPAEILPKVRCPVLWFLADRDSQVPFDESSKRLGAIFAARPDRDQTLRVLSRAGHLFLEQETGWRSELPQVKQFVPGYFDVMSNWLVAHAKPGRDN